MGIFSQTKQQERTTKFKRMARELTNTFPALDLRFNLKDGSDTARVSVPEVSRRVVKLALDSSDAHDLVVSATFALKQLTRAYDA